MSLQKVFIAGELIDVAGQNWQPHTVGPFIESALLAFERVAVDSLEVELQRFAAAKKLSPQNVFQRSVLLNDEPFNATTKLVHHIWRLNSDNKMYQYTAGAPEAVIAASGLSNSAKQQAVAAYQKLSSESYRVVGVAKTAVANCKIFSTAKLGFCGLLAMSDRPRAGVKEAVAICRAAGIRVLMITGDHALTAHAVAEQIGIDGQAEVVEGGALDTLTEAEIQELVSVHSVFARIRPEQKFRLVKALQANGEIVAMTGDGVNDAPALKKATVGIAMGKKGTEVAREAAGMVLLDDNFTTIVHAVEEGRRIYDNMRQAFLFLFSFHIPVVGLAIIPLLLGQGLYFFPIHIIFLELFGDPITVLGLERDPLRPGAMREKPRPVSEPLINPKLWWQIGCQGAGILGVALLFYGYGFWFGGLMIGRTMSFAALVMSQMILMLINRDWYQVKENKLLLFLIALTLLLLHIILFVPGARAVFHFSPLTFVQYVYVLLGAMVTMLGVNKIAKGR